MINRTTTSNLTPEQSAAILAAFADSELAGFNDFLEKLLEETLSLPEEIINGVQRYLDEETPSVAQLRAIQRLLGLYTRLQYGEQAIATLADLVAIPTFYEEGTEQHENPQFHQIAAYIQALAESFGLAFRNVDERVYEITLGEGEELVGIHAHADVVPANAEDWVLEDGTELDPFQLTRIEGNLYGRGAADNKNGIVATLYAMKVAKEENMSFARELKLLVDTTEESTYEAMEYYLERNRTPDYNFVLDGLYPLNIAEKGYGNLTARFSQREAEGEGAEITQITGSVAGSQIPSTSIATLISEDAESLVSDLLTAAEDYVSENGNDFSIVATADGDTVELKVTGVSAHAAVPETGINPVARMLDFLNGLGESVPLKQNHFTDAARYSADNWGLDYLGKKLGIDFEDDFMGPLTASPTQLDLTTEALSLVVNVRIPKGKALEDIQAELTEKLESWLTEAEVSATFEQRFAPATYQDPEGLWAQALMDIACENLALPREFGSSPGATSAHDLPKGVQFGLSMPNEKYTGHTANEFKSVKQFMLDLQVVTEMVARIGQMPQM